ncbi:MAG TPA: hypothetical protein PLM60_10890 [Methanoregulaceae archaeon]|nr:hypothetical protein [Methanoregulaceae archaeon]
MNIPRHEYGFFLLLVITTLVTTVITATSFWYLPILLLILFSAIFLLTQTGRDRVIYLVCGGEPLVIICGTMNLWAGLIIQCTLAGIISVAMGFFESTWDQRVFALFCGILSLVTLLIELSNHVLLPLFVLGAATTVILAARSVRMYQFRKQYNGARP